MLKQVVIILFCLIGTSTANAGGSGEEEAVDEGLQLVQAFIHDVETFAAEFQQTLLDADGEVVDASAGRLLVQRPGQFRWDNSEPYEQWMIADGLNLWSYDIDLEQVTVKPQSENLANTPASILSGAGASLDQFEHIETYQEDAYLWVRLEPIDETSGFTRMELGFIDETLTRMVFFDSLGQTTLVQLANIHVNEPIAADEFVFELPDGIDLIGTPVSAPNTDDANSG